MTAETCARPIAPQSLIAYWLGELGPDDESRVEEHLLACSRCSAELQSFADLAGAIRSAVRRGRIGSVIAAALPRRLAEAGLRVREYRVARNGSVNCTIAPDDDVVVAHLAVPDREAVPLAQDPGKASDVMRERHPRRAQVSSKRVIARPRRCSLFFPRG